MRIPAQRLLSIIFLSATFFVLAGCGAVSGSDDPEIDEFEIIDTSGSDSATDPESEISVDPDESTTGTEEGEFTLYWAVDTDDDYQLEIRINDRDSFSGSRLFYSNICDPDDDCHDDQSLQCDFQNDLDIVCEDFDDNETTFNLETIVDESDLPETITFILQVCDPFGFDCEDKSLNVEFRD